jgi:hypothetical protein
MMGASARLPVAAGRRPCGALSTGTGDGSHADPHLISAAGLPM